MKKFLTFFSLLTILLITNPTSVAARVVSSETSVTIAEDEVIDDDLFIAGETVTVNGTVSGDLYAAGGMVTINGVVNGDVLAAGGMVNISGTVRDDVRIAGGNLSVSQAKIGDSLNVFGGNVNIDEGTRIEGGVVIGSGTVNLGADVGRGVVGGAGAMTLTGMTGKGVEVGVGSLTIGPEASIGGDLVYYSEEDASVDSRAFIGGEKKKILPETMKAAKDFKGIGRGGEWARIARRVWFGLKTISYFAAFVVGFLVLYLFRKPSGKIVDLMKKSLGRSLGWGLLTLLLAGPVFILLAITGIGLPLAFILAGLFIIEIYLVKIFIGILLGDLIIEGFGRKGVNIYLSFAIGLAVYYVLTSLPIAGFFLKLIFLLLGLGALVSFKRNLLTASKK